MIKLLFGYLFLLFGAGLTYLQTRLFLMHRPLPQERLLLLIGLTTGSLIGAGLALSTIGRKLAAGIALLVCLGLMALFAYHALIRPLGLTEGEYGALIYYIIAFGVYGGSGLHAASTP
jgi:hypothetical protein